MIETEFGNKLNAAFKSMLEIANEFTGFNDKEIETIYVFGSLEESIYFDFFYKINNNISKRHELNDNLKVKIDDSDEQQEAALDIGLENLRQIKEICLEYNKEVPNQIMIQYDVKEQSFKTDLNYEQNLIGKKIDVLELKDKWINELKKHL